MRRMITTELLEQYGFRCVDENSKHYSNTWILDGDEWSSIALREENGKFYVVSACECDDEFTCASPVVLHSEFDLIKYMELIKFKPFVDLEFKEKTVDELLEYLTKIRPRHKQYEKLRNMSRAIDVQYITTKTINLLYRKLSELKIKDKMEKENGEIGIEVCSNYKNYINALSLWMLFECGGSPTKRYGYMDALDEYEYHYYSPREYRQLAMGKE